MKYAIDSPEVNRSYFWCYLVWHNQICPENQVIYLCSGQLKKKKNFNPIWPFLRYSQRKTDSFLSWTTHFYLYYRLLSSLSSGLIQEHWMVHDKSTRLPPKAGRLGNFICFTLRQERENFLRKIKDREDKRERATWFPHSPCVWGRNKPKEIIRFPQSTVSSHGKGCPSPTLTEASRKQAWPSALICFY